MSKAAAAKDSNPNHHPTTVGPNPPPRTPPPNAPSTSCSRGWHGPPAGPSTCSRSIHTSCPRPEQLDRLGRGRVGFGFGSVKRFGPGSRWSWQSRLHPNGFLEIWRYKSKCFCTCVPTRSTRESDESADVPVRSSEQRQSRMVAGQTPCFYHRNG